MGLFIDRVCLLLIQNHFFFGKTGSNYTIIVVTSRCSIVMSKFQVNFLFRFIWREFVNLNISIRLLLINMYCEVEYFCYDRY